MARSFSEKKRNSFVKTPKPLLLLIAEGNGKTKNVIAVYQIDNGQSVPRMITNYP